MYVTLQRKLVSDLFDLFRPCTCWTSEREVGGAYTTTLHSYMYFHLVNSGLARGNIVAQSPIRQQHIRWHWRIRHWNLLVDKICVFLLTHGHVVLRSLVLLTCTEITSLFCYLPAFPVVGSMWPLDSPNQSINIRLMRGMSKRRPTTDLYKYSSRII